MFSLSTYEGSFTRLSHCVRTIKPPIVFDNDLETGPDNVNVSSKEYSRFHYDDLTMSIYPLYIPNLIVQLSTLLL